MGGQTTRTKLVEKDHVILETSRHDSVTQRVYSQNIEMDETETRFYPVQTATPGLRNWISWPVWLACACASVGVAGNGSRSQRRA